MGGGLTHRLWMEQALEVARDAERGGEVPVGAVVVRGGTVVASAGNRREADRDPTAHAELLALRAAARRLDSWRLDDCALYVTLEPCAMCAGAIVLARVPLLVYGARDPKAGAVGSLYDIPRDGRLNHRAEVVEGVLGEQSAALLTRFFRARRGPTAASRASRGGATLASGPEGRPVESHSPAECARLESE